MTSNFNTKTTKAVPAKELSNAEIEVKRSQQEEELKDQLLPVQEIYKCDIDLVMQRTPLKKRNISHFCANYIYNGSCTSPCNRMHTLNLDFIRYYLNDPNIKSVLCENGAHCKYFLCRFGHDFDHHILGRSSVNPDHTVFKHDLDTRNHFRQLWREDKHTAFSQELISGQRKPKNANEQNIIINNLPPLDNPNPVDFSVNRSYHDHLSLFPKIANQISNSQFLKDPLVSQLLSVSIHMYNTLIQIP